MDNTVVSTILFVVACAVVVIWAITLEDRVRKRIRKEDTLKRQARLEEYRDRQERNEKTTPKWWRHDL